MKSLTESNIHSAIVKYLKLFPTKLMALTFKNTGTMRAGKYCPSPNSMLGVSDIIVFPNQAGGTIWFNNNKVEKYTIVTPFFLEVKKPKTKTAKGKQSDDQRFFENYVGQLGYGYYIVYSVDDVHTILKDRGLI